MSNQRHNQEILNSDSNFNNNNNGEPECSDFEECIGCPDSEYCEQSEQRDEERDEDE